MNRLSLFAVTALLPLYASAGNPAPPPTSVDEPALAGLFLLAAAVIGAVKLRAKFKK